MRSNSGGVAAYRNAIALDPVIKRISIGNILWTRTGSTMPLRFTDSHRVGPRRAEGHANLSLALLRQDRHDDAAACQRKAIACDPIMPPPAVSWCGASSKATRLKRSVPASGPSFPPDLAEAYITLGAARLDLDSRKRQSALTAVRTDAGDVRIHCNLGVALIRLGASMPPPATPRGVALDPLHVGAHQSRQALLRQIGREAIAAHRAIALDPDLARPIQIWRKASRTKGGLRRYRLTARLSPGVLHDIQLQPRLALLMEGDYEAGWKA